MLLDGTGFGVFLLDLLCMSSLLGFLRRVGFKIALPVEVRKLCSLVIVWYAKLAGPFLGLTPLPNADCR